jgi:hypothetical protein
MAPSYAGILGIIAFVALLVRGVVADGGPDQVLGASIWGLIAYAGIGYVIGRLAEFVLLDSVRQRLDQEKKGLEGLPRDASRVQAIGAGN